MDQLPAINATLNAASTILLLTGFGFIRRKRIAQHRLCMITAFILSMAFLAGYLLHKWHLYTTTGSYNTTFQGKGAFKVLYFSILATHVVLAATVPVLASITLFRGLKMNVVKHKRLARITLPVWLYVSVTGVIVYFMLYHWSL